jgi:hypothetical protein
MLYTHTTDPESIQTALQLQYSDIVSPNTEIIKHDPTVIIFQSLIKPINHNRQIKVTLHDYDTLMDCISWNVYVESDSIYWLEV